MNISEIAIKELEIRLETMSRAIDSARGAHVMDLDGFVEMMSDLEEAEPFTAYERKTVTAGYRDAKLLRDRTNTLRELHNEAHTLKLLGVDSKSGLKRLEKLEADYEAYRKSTLGLENRLTFPRPERDRIESGDFFGNPGEFWPA
jgi:hypothetical protein